MYVIMHVAIFQCIRITKFTVVSVCRSDGCGLWPIRYRNPTEMKYYISDVQYEYIVHTVVS